MLSKYNKSRGFFFFLFFYLPHLPFSKPCCIPSVLPRNVHSINKNIFAKLYYAQSCIRGGAGCVCALGKGSSTEGCQALEQALQDSCQEFRKQVNNPLKGFDYRVVLRGAKSWTQRLFCGSHPTQDVLWFYDTVRSEGQLWYEKNNWGTLRGQITSEQFKRLSFGNIWPRHHQLTRSF